MKTAAVCLAMLLAVAPIPLSAQVSPCPQRRVDVLARQEVTLREWKVHLDQLGNQIDDLRRVGDALTGTRRGVELATTLQGLGEKIRAVLDYVRARAAFATADRVAQDFPAEAAAWRARGNRHNHAFKTRAVGEVLDLAGLTPQAVLERVVEGGIDAVRRDLEQETRQLRDGLSEDYRAFSAARRAWREAHERCLPDLQVVPSPIAGRNRPPAPGAPPASVPPRPSAATAAVTPPRHASDSPRADAAPARASGHALPNAPARRVSVPASRSGPEARAPRRTIAAGRSVDLDALDRMAEEDSAEPSRPQRDETLPATRPLSQEAYLAACAGKENTAACHRVHCRHVGAALGDEKWTARCLRGD